MTAVNQNGTSLKYASDRLKDDESIVMVAVQNRGYALIYASDRLKDNEAVVLSAVKRNGAALKYASDRLRSDIPFCISIAKISKESIVYFEGEAKDLFETHHNNIDEVEQVYTQQQQNKVNEALLAKISTGEMTISTNRLFKRRLDV
jgi:hypothetical protein